jgi:hypothetical protein
MASPGSRPLIALTDMGTSPWPVIMIIGTWVDLFEGRSDRDGDAQKAPYIHRRPEQSFQRLVAGVLKQRHDSTAFAGELKRSYRPRPVQLIL